MTAFVFTIKLFCLGNKKKSLCSKLLQLLAFIVCCLNHSISACSWVLHILGWACVVWLFIHLLLNCFGHCMFRNLFIAIFYSHPHKQLSGCPCVCSFNVEAALWYKCIWFVCEPTVPCEHHLPAEGLCHLLALCTPLPSSDSYLSLSCPSAHHSDLFSWNKSGLFYCGANTQP